MTGRVYGLGHSVFDMCGCDPDISKMPQGLGVGERHGSSRTCSPPAQIGIIFNIVDPMRDAGISKQRRRARDVLDGTSTHRRLAL